MLGVRKFRSKLDGLLIMFRCLDELLSLPVETRQIAMDSGRIRILDQSLPIPVEGHIQISVFLIGLPQIITAHAQFGVETQRFEIGCFGFLQATQFPQNISQVVMSLCEKRIQTDGF